MATYPHSHGLHLHRPHVNGWLVAVVGLAAALIALGTWVLVDHYAGGSSATEEATTLMDNAQAAWNTGDAAAVPTLYTSDATVISANHTYTGTAAIEKAVRSLHAEGGLSVQRVSPVTRSGDLATSWGEMTMSSAGLTGMPSLGVVQIRDGKIARQWSFGIGMTDPFSNALTP